MGPKASGHGGERWAHSDARAVEDVSTTGAKTNSRIVSLWWSLGDAVKDLLIQFKKVALTRRGQRQAQSQSFGAERSLPADPDDGLRTEAILQERPLGADEKGRDSVVYDGVHPLKKRWGPIRTMGFENGGKRHPVGCQGLLVEAALRVEETGLGDLILSVHDEIVLEVPSVNARPRNSSARDQPRPEWAKDLPIASEGNWSTRYGK